MAERIVKANDVDLCTESFGEPTDPPILLVMGRWQHLVPFGVETGEPVRFNGMFHPVGSDLTMAEATRSRIKGFAIEFEGRTGLSKSEFSWAA